MNIKKEQISSKELFMSIVCYILFSIMLTGYVTATVGRDSWIVEIAGYILSLPIIALYISLASKFPGKSLADINIAVFGNPIGKFISALYAFFFFSRCFLNTDNLNSFIVGFVTPETPTVVIAVMFVFVCCYAALKGLESVMRTSTIIAVTVCLILLLNTSLEMPNFKLSNFMPVLNLPAMKYVTALKAQMFLPFLEIIAFFMVFPSLKNPKKIKKPFFLGLTFGAAVLLIIMLRNIGVLGPMITFFSNPAYESIRMIDFRNVLTRMEFFYAVLLLVLSFFKVSVLIFVICKILEQIFNLKSYKILVPIIGVLVVLFSLIAFNTSSEDVFWGTKIAANYSMFFELILPLITLITAKMRGFKKPEVQNEQ